MKDSMPLPKYVTVSNTDTSSQLMIPSSERHDTGIYTIIVKNLVGQETSSVEMRFTGRFCNIFILNRWIYRIKIFEKKII